MLVKDITDILEEFAPIGYQEGFDNSGLLVGSPASKVNGILICLDITLDIIEESIATGANLIVSHHPIIFGGLKRITGSTPTEQIIVKAIANGIALYSAHTNIDSVWGGLNHELGKRIGLTDIEVLSPASDQLVKLITFAPHDNAQAVRDAIFEAGAGTIGEYDSCSYNTEGYGTFKAGADASPHVGQKGSIHTEPETRIEVVVPKPILKRVLKAMHKAHPYEEVAYDTIPILNSNPRAGLGVIGNLPEPISATKFLTELKETLSVPCIKHTSTTEKQIQRIAICGGSGGSLIADAIARKADLFVTADLKYHNFMDARNSIVLADVGHYESEILVVDIFYELLTKKLTNFAVLKSKVSTNPINYL